MVLRSAKHKNSAGFTLIEVMAAAMIFTFGSMGMLAMLNAASMANHDSSVLMEANNVASSVLNELLALPNSELQALNGTGGKDKTYDYDGTGLATEQNKEATDGTYTVSWNIDYDEAAGYVDIIVTAKWWDITKQTGAKKPGIWRVSSVHGGRNL